MHIEVKYYTREDIELHSDNNVSKVPTIIHFATLEEAILVEALLAFLAEVFPSWSRQKSLENGDTLKTTVIKQFAKNRIVSDP